MLRLLLAWRLIRILSPLLILALLALALGAAVRGIPSAPASRPSIARAVRGAERAIHPLIVDLRQALSHTLAGSSR